jgi:hypothetical protein
MNLMNTKSKSLTLLIAVVLLRTTLCAAASDYRLLKKANVAGEEGWDYLIYDALGAGFFSHVRLT